MVTKEQLRFALRVICKPPEYVFPIHDQLKLLGFYSDEIEDGNIEPDDIIEAAIDVVCDAFAESRCE